VSPVINADSGIRTHSTSVTQLSDIWGPCLCAAVCSLKTELTNDRHAYGLKYRVFARVVAALLVHTTVR
jgi:hypothetical protein